ncbi:hypothetical protein EJB05_24207, partial [Eragrostis curvula]
MEPKMEEPPRSAPALAASAAAISMVLGDYDLVTDILLRLAPSGCLSLVRAAAVCRLWLRAASDPAFLRRFRDLLPRGLIGFYLTAFSESRSCWFVEFVPMQPHIPRRARFGLDGYASLSSRVVDCRDGRVVASLYRGGDFTHGVHSPLDPAARGLDLDVFPPLPTEDTLMARDCWIFKEFLSKGSGDGLSYIWFTLDYSHGNTATACVYTLQDDAWRMHSSASTQIDMLYSSPMKTMSIFLSDDKIYMGITKKNILVLDLTSSTFFTIQFHAEMALGGEVRLARGDGSGVYLVHANELELCIWLHRPGNGGVGDWSLLHTIYLSDMCANLKMPIEHGRTPVVYLHEVGNNAEFVFLEMCGWVLSLDVKTRELKKVYEVPEKTGVGWIHPFVTKLAPTFPALK